MMTVFEDVVGVECSIRRDETVYDPPPGYDLTNRKLVRAGDIWDEAEKHLTKHRLYQIREGQWAAANGPD